jgi:hypothetical protein
LKKKIRDPILISKSLIDLSGKNGIELRASSPADAGRPLAGQITGS